jgi:hypothetical protein
MKECNFYNYYFVIIIKLYIFANVMNKAIR